MPAKKKFKEWLIFAIFFYVGLTVFAWFSATMLLYRPVKWASFPALPHLRSIDTAVGRITLLVLQHKKPKATIIFSHGNAGNLVFSYRFLKALYNKGYTVIGYDYSGYGMSTGQPSESVIKKNSEDILQYVTKHLKISQTSIILMGHSLGTGPTMHLAVKGSFKRVVLISPFLSVYRTKIPISFPPFLGDSFNNAALAERVTSPVVIIHGVEDWLVFPRNATLLYSLFQTPKKIKLLPGIGHNGIPFKAIMWALGTPLRAV